MPIIVLGAGAIGSVYGAQLSTSNDVTLLARAAHADAINRDGLRIIGADEATYRVWAATRLDDARWAGAYFAPWVKRRLTGKSSGDNRIAKRPTLGPPH